MKFTISHPTDPQVCAEYGFDHALGFFVSVRNHGTRWDYDSITKGYRVRRPLRGALEYLAQHGFYGIDDLHRALLWVERHGSGNPPKRLRIPVEVVCNFMQAGD